jgi:hypothetical protein
LRSPIPNVTSCLTNLTNDEDGNPVPNPSSKTKLKISPF